MATPHNNAEKGDFASTVLMPGDPLRAKWIAESFLEDALLVSDVRNVLAYTGKYNGRPISVMASGMGMPSIGIYSYELYSRYDVENIIRIGSAGAYSPELELMDVVLTDFAWSESSFAQTQNGDSSHEKHPSRELNRIIEELAAGRGIKLHRGGIHSSDVFYRDGDALERAGRLYEEKGLLCVEMESFALFHNADVLRKKAACLLTISDSLVSGRETSAAQRQSSFSDMVILALEAGIRA